MSQSVAEAKGQANVTVSHDEKFKTGQKFSTPAPGNGDRVFYESLYKQKPSSEMGQEWCVAYGILSEADALKLHTAICKRKGKPLTVSPMRNDPKKSTSGGNGGKMRRINDDDIEADTGLVRGGGWEGVGTMGL